MGEMSRGGNNHNQNRVGSRLSIFQTSLTLASKLGRVEILLDLTRFYFSVEMVFASRSGQHVGIWKVLNTDPDFYRDRGLPPRFFSPIAEQQLPIFVFKYYVSKAAFQSGRLKKISEAVQTLFESLEEKKSGKILSEMEQRSRLKKNPISH